MSDNKSSKNFNLSPQTFIHTELSLLAAEQATEIHETTLLLSSAAPATLSQAGLAVLNLQISSLRTGLGGRTVVELAIDPAFAGSSSSTTKSSSKSKPDNSKPTAKPKSEDELPEHGIRTGDIVRLSEMPKGSAEKKEVSDLKNSGVEGVVTRTGERAIWMAVGKGGNKDDDGDAIDSLSGTGRLWL